jgi:peptidase A4-like protein
MRSSAVRRPTLLLVSVVLGAMIGAFVLGSIGGVAHASAPAQQAGIRASLTQTSSLNWAGYADTAANGKVTAVTGAWTEPTVTCPKHGSPLAVFWVGIDGFNSNTVEQTGTLAQCSHGAASYSAWWELFPLNSIQTISTITVKAGDSITASVTFSTAGFTMAITDVNASQSFSITATQSGTARSSSECIAERPSIGGHLSPLANFGKMTFSSCNSTIGGTTAGIGASTVTANAITMVDSRGLTLAKVSSTTNSGATFSVTWVRSS